MTEKQHRSPWWTAAVGLADVWGDDVASRALKTVRRIVRTADVARTLRLELRARNRVAGGELHHHATWKLGFVHIPTSGHIDRLLSDYLHHVPTTRVCESTNDNEGELVMMALPNGVKAVLQLQPFGSVKVVTGVFVERGTSDEVLDGIATLIWDSHSSGSLELRIIRNWGDPELVLQPIVPASDYVAVDNGVTSELDALASRTKKFIRKGFSRRILLYGPPGTGKTTIAKHMVTDLGGRLLQVHGSDVASEGSAIRQLLQILHPSVVLLDDLDRCRGGADKLMGVLTDLSHKNHHPMVVIGTANVVSALDPALLRPERFDEVHHIAEPTEAYRRLIVEHYADKFDVDIDSNEVTTATKGFAPVDIRELMVSAGSVGVDVLTGEIERLKAQRVLYSGDACTKFQARQPGLLDTNENVESS